MPGKYRLTTLGCKVNQYESQVLRRIMASCGWVEAAAGDSADLVVLNSCAVTQSAMKENAKVIRRAARHNTRVIVVGCGASADPAGLSAMSHVAAVLGHDVNLYEEIPRQLSEIDSPSNRATMAGNSRPLGGQANAAPPEASRSDAGRFVLGAPASTARRPSSRIIPLLSEPVKNHGTLVDRIDAFGTRHRAFLKVQDGCDAFCTYCIIPQLRSTLRWKPIDLVVQEALGLVRAGFKEIVLTGIFLGAYGRHTAIRKRFERSFSPLARLIKALSKVTGLERLRLSSLEPGDVQNDLIEAMIESKPCVPHLHLPLQSGSPRILKRMNRQYTQDEFLLMLERVRQAFDRPAISTDVLVGFPGETDADFQSTLDVSRAARFCKIHAFPFSPRKGTRAAHWQAQFVSDREVQRRMKEVARVESEISFAYRTELLGFGERLIVEDGDFGPMDSGPLMKGRADRYIEVYFEPDRQVRPGDLVNVTIERVTPARTHASLAARGLRFPLPVLRQNPAATLARTG